jgi:Na+/proline symporter
VTDLVRRNGVAGNWAWWSFLLTGMMTVFLYARMWRRSGVTTDLEFYELRYGGRPAAFLRGFRALYLGVLCNVIVMATVSLAAIKLANVMLGLSPVATLLWASLATVIFSAVGGFRAVVLTDAGLFVVSMIGAIAAAYFAVNHPDVGGLSALVANPQLSGKLAMIPDLSFRDEATANTLITVLVIPLAVQWWNVWYPAAEPGGGGYVAQRMLAAKDENNAVGAVMFFNAAMYALRPWPWILVALASLLVFPELTDLRAAFPSVPEDKLGHDLAYAAMLTYLPPGWTGIVAASLLAAYMSTISTHLNWGASYVVNDFYCRFVAADASERRRVQVGRVTTLFLMAVSSLLALRLNTATQGFQLLLQVGAGTGLIFLLRWYWWRVNAFSEITAMIVSFCIAAGFQLFPDHGLATWQVLCLQIAATTAAWVVATFATRPEHADVLESFCRLVRPAGPGWKRVYRAAADAGDPIPPAAPGDNLSLGVLRMTLGCISIYAALFATGYGLYGNLAFSALLGVVSLVGAALIALTYRQRPHEIEEH